MAEDDAFRKGLALAGRVGVELVAATVVGVGLGYGLDRWLGTGPWLMIVGVFFGAAAGILGIFRLVRNL
ncbi:MAG: AtpZ/AtpI family protein [Nitrospirota bacterium]